MTRVLLLSLEFLGPVFSGNGQYSRCLVRGLKAAGDVTVCVISGRRSDVPLDKQDAEGQSHARAPHVVVDVPLSSWGTLDVSSVNPVDFEGFAKACATDPRILQAVISFAPDAVACVDWHGVAAWRSLRRQLSTAGHDALARLPDTYLNFRVYSTSSGLNEFAVVAPFYRRVESAAVRECACTVALCRTDAVALASLALGRDPLTALPIDDDGCTAAESEAYSSHYLQNAARGILKGSASIGDGEPSRPEGRALPAIRILLPPLRSDVAKLALAPPSNGTLRGTARRRYLTSVVRLSPEKGPHRFAELVVALAPTLRRLGIVPFVAGAVGDKAYAEGVVGAIRAAMPESEVVTSFMGPAELQSLFSATVLNVHGALSDAYGMTLVEAAAFGAPSLVNIPAALTSEAPAPQRERSQTPDPLVSFRAHSGGYMTMDWAPRATGSESDSEELCRLAFPPVGACDLLSPTPQPDRHGTNGGLERGAPAVLGLDLTQPMEETARIVAGLLEAAVGPSSEEAGGHRGKGSVAGKAGASLGRIAVSAYQAAVNWTEPDTADALLKILGDAASR